MRALTIRQPWAALIAHADKRIENRVWPTSYRGPLLIHAGKSIDRRAMEHPPVAAEVRRLREKGIQLELGAVIAVAQLSGCHSPDGFCTRWSAPGQFHFELDDDVLALPLPVPWTGRLQLWHPPAELVARIRPQLSDEQAAQLPEVSA
ncbi:ASCH domain-containing protein [Streptomyces antimycoticus]|uniref:ASCH domain-containing protein n=1 Tax=Streptomyces antimycoticus TaxID=68175 RepID=UPI000A3B6157|nr:ASCH domain-containing protein [Streptomyces antimycoticus]